MSLLFALFAVNWVFFACHAAPTGQCKATRNTATSYSGFQIWSITPHSQSEQTALFKIIKNYKLEIWKETKELDDPVDIMVPPRVQKEVRQKLKEAKLPYDIEILDLQKEIKNENPIVNASASTRNAAHQMDWTRYHRLDDIYGYLKYLADTYPCHVQLINIGTSYEGRPLYVVHISNSTSAHTPAIWIDGTFHAREWISPAVVTYIIQQLVEDPANLKLLQNVDWYIMPVVNPDGYEYSHVSSRLWRKTRSPSEVESGRCQGVDPNRNFDFKWGGAGSSSNPCSQVYKGPKAFSEPETLAYANFISSISYKTKLYLTLHSSGQKIMLPWGYDRIVPHNFDEMLALAQNAACKFKLFNYKVGNKVDLLYRASGNSADWAASIGIEYVYSVELPIRGFVLPASNIIPVSQDFFRAMDVFADKVSTLTVVVK
ncbi:carboxypeptidase B-like [Daphnia pulicaria]|uniref:carboxypeptidase B-like n=1 Tax=Daphnia pulicaria TaxID=35523 RepID=UPI001EEBA82E|nr:carboxypeptidase B-like [Daphnia pulicaria]